MTPEHLHDHDHNDHDHDDHNHDHADHADHAHGHGHGHGRSPDRPLVDASVRRAQAADSAAMGLVQAAVWQATYLGVLPPDVLAEATGPAFARIWRASLEAPPTPRHIALVALAGDQVVGLAALGPSQDPDADDSTGELIALVVHPDAWRSGHGSRLLNACVDVAREHRFTWVDAWLSIADERGRAFLTSAGMVPDKARRQRVVSESDEGPIQVMEVRLGAAIEMT